MDARTKRTLVIVGSSTIIGFLGDVITYSIAMSKDDGKFKIHFPKGKDLAQVIAFGIVTGFIADYITNKIIESQKLPQEKQAEKLLQKDITAIYEGKLKATKPISINWA
jgi:hypothetical protein